MKRTGYYLIIILLIVSCKSNKYSGSGIFSPNEGVYYAVTDNMDPFLISLIKNKNDSIRVAYIGYNFEASLSVGNVLLKSRDPFGKIVDGVLEIQFPVFLKFAPNTGISESGGTSYLVYYQAYITQEETDELGCELIKIDDLDEQYTNKFTMRDIKLATPPEDAIMEDEYSFTLKLQTETN